MQRPARRFRRGAPLHREVPVKTLTTADGKQVTVTTVYDLLMAQYGVPRGLGGDYPADYDDDDAPYTPAWQEKFTGLGRKDLLQFAREWASTAEHTGGKCTIIIGAGINHWYHGNLMYRAGIHALMFCGCVGKNGGGLAHYVGQEKLAPAESWGAIAFAKDWIPASRLQNAPSWHYVNTDQWRYEKSFTDYHTVPPNQPEGSLAVGHTMDAQVRAVRNGWLPFYPQFNQNSLDLVREAEEKGEDVVALHGGQAEEARAPVLGRRSRRLRELAARLVHLARQRADVQQQGPRVLPAALPGDPRQRDRRPRSPRTRSRKSCGTRRRPRERWIWSST